MRTFRRRLTGFESTFSKKYFQQIFKLFDEEIRPKGRKTFLAFDGLNNVFNLAYEMLRWKVHIALLKAHLEPYLGFLHSLQHGKPSLVCDFISKLNDWLEDLAEVIDDITNEGWDEYHEERSEFDEHLNPVNKRDSQLHKKDDD